jgi:fucose 4-O-acetylase-like acetyltransferase
MVGRRIEWIDTARGIGIILVVYGHVLRGLQGAGIIDVSSPIWLSDYAIYTFHMPLFLLLAGINVESSLAKGRRQFFLGKLWTIAYPYLLWSIIQGSLQSFLPSVVNHPRSTMFLLSIVRQPYAQFWFLYALFVCHMLALLVGNRKWLLALLGVVAFALCTHSLGEPTSYAFGFYALGILFGARLKEWGSNTRVSGGYLFGVALVFAVCEHFGRALSGASVTSFCSVPAALAGIAMICVASRLVVVLGRSIPSALTSLGVMSMTIYILHVLAAVSARLLLKRLGLVGFATELSVGVIVGLGLPIIAHLVLQRLHLLTELGLAPLRRASKRADPPLPEGQALA